MTELKKIKNNAPQRVAPRCRQHWTRKKIKWPTSRSQEAVLVTESILFYSLRLLQNWLVWIPARLRSHQYSYSIVDFMFMVSMKRIPWQQEGFFKRYKVRIQDHWRLHPIFCQRNRVIKAVIKQRDEVPRYELHRARCPLVVVKIIDARVLFVVSYFMGLRK